MFRFPHAPASKLHCVSLTGQALSIRSVAKNTRGHAMHYTYILRSIKNPGAIYIGYTSDLKRRLSQHNDPRNTAFTKRHAPGEIESCILHNLLNV